MMLFLLCKPANSPMIIYQGKTAIIVVDRTLYTREFPDTHGEDKFVIMHTEKMIYSLLDEWS